MSNSDCISDQQQGNTQIPKNESTKNHNQNPWFDLESNKIQINEEYFPCFGIYGIIEMTWKSFTAVNIILLWVVMVYTKKVEQITNEQYNCILYQYGALYMPSVKYNYEFIRYLLPNFLHGNFLHIICNTIGLFLYGFNLEKAFGVKKFLILYILSCLGGTLLSGAQHPNSLIVGASSSIFGLYPLMLLYIIENRNIPKLRKIVYYCYILFQLAESFGLFNQNKDQNVGELNVDQAAHLGGFLTGGLVSVIYYLQSHQETSKFAVHTYICYIVLIVYFSFLFAYNQTNEIVIEPGYIEYYCSQNK